MRSDRKNRSMVSQSLIEGLGGRMGVEWRNKKVEVERAVDVFYEFAEH